MEVEGRYWTAALVPDQAASSECASMSSGPERKERSHTLLGGGANRSQRHHRPRVPSLQGNVPSGGIFFLPPPNSNIDSNPRMKGCFGGTEVAATCRHRNRARRQNSERLTRRKGIRCQHSSEGWNCGLPSRVCACAHSIAGATAKGSPVKGRLKAELRPYLVSIKTFCVAQISLRLQQRA